MSAKDGIRAANLIVQLIVLLRARMRPLSIDLPMLRRRLQPAVRVDLGLQVSAGEKPRMGTLSLALWVLACLGCADRLIDPVARG